MKKIAFISIGLPGHLRPNIPVMCELRKRGHNVRSFLPLGAAGPAFEPTVPFDLYRSAFRPPYVQFDGFDMPGLPLLFANEIEFAVPQINDMLVGWKPDIAIVEGYTLAGMIACEALGIPVVRADSTYAFHKDLSYFRMCETGLAEGVLTSPESLAVFEQSAEAVCLRYGVKPRCFHEWMEGRGVRNLCYVARNFHPNVDLFPDVDFVGPTIDDGLDFFPDGIGDWTPDTAGRRVLVSFGSVFHDIPYVVEPVVAALKRLGVEVLVLGVDENESPLPDYLPIRRMLKGCDLFISHGGMGGVMEALWRGVPCLCIPQHPDQNWTAQTLFDHSLGVGLHRHEVSIRNVVASVGGILNSTEFKDNAFDFGASMRHDGGHIRAADIVEEAIAADDEAQSYEKRPPTGV